MSDMVHPELLKDVQHGASDTEVTLKKIQKNREILVFSQNRYLFPHVRGNTVPN